MVVRQIRSPLPPDPELVEIFKGLLADAESGALSAFAGVAEYHKHETTFHYGGNADWWGIRGRLLALGEEITYEEEDDE